MPAEVRDAFKRSLVDDHGLATGDAEAVSVTGGPEQVADRLAAFVAAGAHGLVLAPTGPDWKRQVDLLARARAQLSLE